MNYIINSANPETLLSVGGVLSRADIEAGYIGIIGAMISDSCDEPAFQDLKVTKSQLENLRARIEAYLEYKGKYPD